MRPLFWSEGMCKRSKDPARRAPTPGPFLFYVRTAKWKTRKPHLPKSGIGPKVAENLIAECKDPLSVGCYAMKRHFGLRRSSDDEVQQVDQLDPVRRVFMLALCAAAVLWLFYRQ